PMTGSKLRAQTFAHASKGETQNLAPHVPGTAAFILAGTREILENRPRRLGPGGGLIACAKVNLDGVKAQNVIANPPCAYRDRHHKDQQNDSQYGEFVSPEFGHHSAKIGLLLDQ